jgi:chromosome partitioning protein
MRTIAIVSQKGGTGKTTTTYALGSLLSKRGRRTLMVDLDPQASLSASSGVHVEDGSSLAQVLLGAVPMAEILYGLAATLSLAPSSIDLAYTELVLIGKMGRENQLHRSLEGVAENFDYCLIDCPPSLGLLTLNGLVAASQALIPARPEYLGLRALHQLLTTIEEVHKELNPSLQVLGILPTFWRSRVKHHEEVLVAWQEAGLPILEIKIPETVRAAEAPVQAQSISDYAPGSPIAAAYQKLAEKIDA